MKALISPLELCETGYRVAEVHATGFEVAQPLFWIDCADGVLPDQFWYDPADETIKPIPEPVVDTVNVVQPTVNGAEQL